MRGVLTRIPRLLSASVIRRPPPRAPPAAAVPWEFLKWASVGFSRSSRFATGFSPLQPKPLPSIIDIERANSCSPEDLLSAWDDYHLGRGHIGTSIKAKLYHLLEQRSITCRHFVIPLWRGSGYTTMFVQGNQININKKNQPKDFLLQARASDISIIRTSARKSTAASASEDPRRHKNFQKTSIQMPHMIFTGLEDYKAKGTQASPYFTVTHYTEFEESKGVVLIRGDIVFTSKLSDSEARWLLDTSHSFYLNDARYKLVEQFNKETHDFEFTDVLCALEMATL